MIIRVTPRAMLNTFFRRRYIFASFFLLVFGLAATYLLIRPPRYESDAALLVKFAPVNRVKHRIAGHRHCRGTARTPADHQLSNRRSAKSGRFWSTC